MVSPRYSARHIPSRTLQRLEAAPVIAAVKRPVEQRDRVTFNFIGSPEFSAGGVAAR